MQFDAEGNLIEFDGTPILLNASVPRDSDVLQLLEVYRPNITALELNTVGHTKVYLEGSSTVCRKGECNLGNLITDSMIYARVLADLGGTHWTDAPIAIIQGGGIRTSIEKKSDGSITESDVAAVLPFGNDIFMTKVRGKTLRAAFERSAQLRNEDNSGGFLQASGIHVVIDYNQEKGHYVTSLQARCAECDVPKYEDVDDNKFYNILVPEFLLDGGDGHKFTEDDDPYKVALNVKDKDAFIQYLQVKDFVYPEIEGRIIVRNGAAILSASIFSMVAVLFAFLFH